VNDGPSEKWKVLGRRRRTEAQKHVQWSSEHRQNSSVARLRQVLGRREAFLERQRLGAERAAKKEAEQASKAVPTSLRASPAGRGNVIRVPVAVFQQDFASAIAEVERAGPRWDGSSRIRWQAIAIRPSRATFAVGDRISHAKFGSGTVVAVDGYRLRVVFGDLAFGENIHRDFVVRQ
jgi:hypothetical protein